MQDVKKAFRLNRHKKEKPEAWNIEDVKDRLHGLEELVAKDPTNVENVEQLKEQLERLEYLIARQKHKVMMEGEESSESGSSEEEEEGEEDDEEEDDSSRLENWVRPGIVVKVTAKNLGSKYHKKKGFVRELTDDFTAVVTMIESGSKVKLDQSFLETVIPGPGGKVAILNGPHRGETGVLR